MLTEEAGSRMSKQPTPGHLARPCQERPGAKQEVPARAEAFQQKAATEDFYGENFNGARSYFEEMHMLCRPVSSCWHGEQDLHASVPVW